MWGLRAVFCTRVRDLAGFPAEIPIDCHLTPRAEMDRSSEEELTALPGVGRASPKRLRDPFVS